MKNITVLTVLVIILGCPVYAQAAKPEKYSFSVTPGMGIFLGRTEEIVYSTSGNYYNEMVSQLLWDIKNIFYYSLNIDFSPVEPLKKHGLFSTLALKYAIPAASGIMEDRDWESEVSSELTCYSRHDNLAQEFLFLDFIAGYSFPFKNMFVIKPEIALSYMHFSFAGMDGYQRRGEIFTSFQGRGQVITYIQDWYLISTGAAFGIKFLERFYFELDFLLSPLVICIDLDFHVLRNVLFKDYMSGGFFLEGGAFLSFNINKWITISLKASYRNIAGTRGAAYTRDINKKEKYFTPASEAGSALALIDTALALKIRF